MTYEWRPGMKFYEAVWEREGQRVLSFCMHAACPADVVATAEAYAEHPDYGVPGGLQGATVRVGLLGGVNGSFQTIFEDMPDA